jgi:hypothetical protein
MGLWPLIKNPLKNMILILKATGGGAFRVHCLQFLPYFLNIMTKNLTLTATL